VASEKFVEEHGLGDQAIEIVGQSVVTDLPSTFADRNMISLVGADMSRTAARQAYEQAGIGPDDVDVIELHDCFSPNELFSYEVLGLTAEGEGHLLLDKGDTTYGGRWVVNPSGGLISKGTRWALPAWPSAPSSPRNCAGRPTSVRSRAHRWRCSTTSAWAGRPWSRCTGPPTAEQCGIGLVTAQVPSGAGSWLTDWRIPREVRDGRSARRRLGSIRRGGAHLSRG